MTRNEAREKLGLDEIQGGDELYIPSNLFPIGEVDQSSIEDNDQPVDAEGNEKLYDLAYGTKAEVGRDEYTTEEEAQDRADEIGCVGTHSHETPDGTIYMPCETHDDYINAIANDKALADLDLKPTTTMSNNAKRGLEMRKEFGRGGTQVGVTRANQLVNRTNLSPDTVLRMYSFFSRHEVDKQATGFNSGEEGYPSNGKIGCVGTHSHETPDGTIYMPCETHDDYINAIANDKALADLDLKPTTTMSNNAKRGLEMRKEFGRGGTQVGVTRANQLVNRTNLSPDTVLRMYSFFSRHEVDKQATGFNSGEEGHPSIVTGKLFSHF